MKENIGTVEYASLLYDFYGALLSESQLEVMTMYHEDNLSLSEIADELGMSRQAVHYTLKKAESKLEEYDAKLGLVAQYRENQALAERAIELLDQVVSKYSKNAISTLNLEEALHEVREIIRKITD